MEQTYKGRVLRVKTGYNPNSSSVGSLIPTFLALSTSAAAMAVLAINGLNTIDKHIRKKKKSLNSEGEK